MMMMIWCIFNQRYLLYKYYFDLKMLRYKFDFFESILTSIKENLKILKLNKNGKILDYIFLY